MVDAVLPTCLLQISLTSWLANIYEGTSLPFSLYVNASSCIPLIVSMQQISIATVSAISCVLMMFYNNSKSIMNFIFPSLYLPKREIGTFLIKKVHLVKQSSFKTNPLGAS